ncbi:phosphoribosylamine--glycine ligase [Halodesulfurarchaeum sp.]|uniref:phosphoribosylamine--glycine ligase n=1 Tax=Halodesulfurarchaeum sp. TaxID=1980530 RepID=UPI002FC29C5E
MKERVLLVGGGGREHAIARALADTTVYGFSSNRNPGIDSLAETVHLGSETDTDAIVDFATEVDATVAMIGPEASLAAGVVDALEDAGVYAFGPPAEMARLETDKAYQREFMAEQGIDARPAFETFGNPEPAIDYLESVDGDVAVKPRGLTGGKGVRVTGDQLSKTEATVYIRESDYKEWVIEERLVGEEFTVQAFVANDTVRPTLAVQDHKRAYEGDEGPNTGGMGSYSDTGPVLPFMTREEYEAAVEILEETVEALGDYRGVLYGQFMLTSEGPKVIEYNVRFGDPEAMNTLPVLETDFLDVLTAARNGSSLPALEFSGQATVCKYAVPSGYPVDPDAGAKITVEVNEATETDRYYASVDEQEDGLYTTTSRSFAVLGRGESIVKAESRAEAALVDVGEGFHIRHDIGTDELVESRIDHMETIRGM